MLRAMVANARPVSGLRRSAAALRALSSAAPAGDAAWETAWRSQIDAITGDVGSYDESAEQLREITRSGVLRFADLHDNPSRFFWAHRCLPSSPRSSGRLFVVSLCSTTSLPARCSQSVATLACANSRRSSARASSVATLTEKLAGVNSGLVVGTNITRLPDEEFLLESGDVDGSRTGSRRLVGDKVVVANQSSAESPMGRMHS